MLETMMQSENQLRGFITGIPPKAHPLVQNLIIWKEISQVCTTGITKLILSQAAHKGHMVDLIQVRLRKST